MIEPLLYFWYFLKASLFSTGGLSNLPSLHQDLIAAGWAEDADFGRSVVLGQLSPGPTGLWVVGLGYFTYGIPGATLPSFVVLAVAAGYARIARARWLTGAMRGVALAVVGIQLSVVWTILRQPGVDWRGFAIAAGAFGVLASEVLQ